MTIGDETRDLGPGDVVCVNRGIEHELYSENGVTFFEALAPVPLDHVPDKRARPVPVRGRRHARRAADVGEFDGKVALVTGGGRGIGAGGRRAAAARAARRSRRSTSTPSGSPDGAVPRGGRRDRLRRRSPDAVARVEREVGPIDAVVCCAGTAGDSLRTVDVTDDEWRRVFALNCDGVFYFNREAARVMAPRGSGRIVNVASIAGKEGNPMAAAYSASQGRGDRDDEVLRQGPRDVRRARQRGRAGRDRDADALPDVPGAHRLHGREDPDGTPRAARTRWPS